MILVLDSFRKQGIVFWFFALEYEAGEIKKLTINTVTPNFVAIFVFFGTASSFIERISFSEIEAKREGTLFLLLLRGEQITTMTKATLLLGEDQFSEVCRIFLVMHSNYLLYYRKKFL